MQPIDVSAHLLSWYDHNAREMPWRVGPSQRLAGVLPDPYRVWLSEVMLQQTTVVTVGPYFRRFLDLWPTVAALAKAPDDQVMAQWAGLGYYARARNLLKCARAVTTDHAGVFPDEYDTLLRLPGIGPYTAAAIAAIAFDRPRAVVDGNVERVMARLFDVRETLDLAKPRLVELAQALTPESRPGDYAQAVMDLGATICTPKNPRCADCPVRGACLAQGAGIAAELPRRKPRVRKPTRRGVIYVAMRQDGALLLERRPARGLLGGMLGWPGSQWARDAQDAPPFAANWREAPAEVRHTFTHFHLRLSVKVATVPNKSAPDLGTFIPVEDFRPSDLPTVMRKVYDVAAPLLQEI